MFQILIVDDDKNIRRYFSALLTQAGYQTYCADSAEAALELMEKQCVDLAVLDIMMPGMDGYEFTRLLRNSNSMLPILMVSAKALPDDVKKGFLAGTDDYMTKPVDEGEMLLRIRALLRRAKIFSDRKITVGSTVLDWDTMSVTVGSVRESLPQKEFALLYKLLSYPNQIFTRNQLMEEIWGPDCESSDNTVFVHINRLRKRFEDNHDFHISTIRGLGYRAVVRRDSL